MSRPLPPRTDEATIRRYVELVDLYIRRLERRSMGDFMLGRKISNMGPEMLQVADRLVTVDEQDDGR